MTPRTGTTAPGDESFRRGRLAKATEFLEAGEYSRSGAHDEAAPVLRAAAGQWVAKHLEVLLAVKTKAEYNARSVSDSDIVRAGEAAEALEAAARSV